MRNFILKFIRLYKMINFTKRGDLVIYGHGSTIVFTVDGDVMINAKRHTIHNRRLFFDGCDPKFVEESVAVYEQGEEKFNKYIDHKMVNDEFQAYKEAALR